MGIASKPCKSNSPAGEVQYSTVGGVGDEQCLPSDLWKSKGYTDIQTDTDRHTHIQYAYPQIQRLAGYCTSGALETGIEKNLFARLSPG